MGPLEYEAKVLTMSPSYFVSDSILGNTNQAHKPIPIRSTLILSFYWYLGSKVSSLLIFQPKY
jgi:hypothetical protein